MADTESQDSTDTTVVDSTLTSDNLKLTDQPGFVQPLQEAADVLEEVPVNTSLEIPVNTTPEVPTVELGCRRSHRKCKPPDCYQLYVSL